MTLLLKLAALGGIALALLSAYPGVLADLLFIAVLFSPLWFCPACFVGLVLLSLSGRSTQTKMAIDPELPDGDEIGSASPARSLRGITASIAVLVVCLALVLTGLPRRIAFILSRTAFERYVATAPASGSGGEPLGRLLGAYYVDSYAADPRGGVYFRTHSGADGIGPDTMSYGFAYRPNAQGTPFGRAGYRCSRVSGDWYEFSASNDF
jgi:hypothetical protein